MLEVIEMPDKFDKISKGNGGYNSLIDTVNATVSDIDVATKKIESLKEDLRKKNSDISSLKKEYAERVPKEDLEANIYNKGNSQSIINEITNTNVIFNEQWNAQYRKDIFSEKPTVDIPDNDSVTYRYGNSDVYNPVDIDSRTTKHYYGKIVFGSTNNGIRFEAVDSYEVVSPMGCTINGELIMAFLKLNIKYKDSDGSDLETLPTIDQLTETKTEYRLMMLTSNSTEWVDAPTDVYDLDGNLIGNLNHMIFTNTGTGTITPLSDELSENKLAVGWGGDPEVDFRSIFAFKTTDSDNIFLFYLCSAKKHGVTLLRFNRYKNVWDAIVNSKFGMDENGYIYEMCKKWFGEDIVLADTAFPSCSADRFRGNTVFTGAREFYTTDTQPFNSLTMDECFVKEDNEYKYYALYMMYGINKTENIRLNDEYTRVTVDGKQCISSITKLGPTSSKRIFVFFTYRISKKDGKFESIACFKKDPLLTECNLDVPVSTPQTDKDCIGWVVNSPFDFYKIGGWWCSDPLKLFRIVTPSLKSCTKSTVTTPSISLSYIGQYVSNWSGNGYNNPGQMLVDQLHKITFDLDGMNEERTSVYNKSKLKFSSNTSETKVMALCSYSAPSRGWGLPYVNRLSECCGTNRYPIHYISYNNKKNRKRKDKKNTSDECRTRRTNLCSNVR